MDWYQDEVRQLERSRVNGALPRCPVVFYGSSTIRMWNSLAADLDNQRAVNLGFGGSTLAACVHFFPRLVLPTTPSSLVIYAGDNDIGDGRTAEDVLQSFRALAEIIDRNLPQVPWGFISIKLSPVRMNLASSIRRANALIRSEIDSRPRAYYIDVIHAMLDSGGRPKPELFLEDGLHLSPAGYEVWTRCLRGHRNQIFTKDCS